MTIDELINNLKPHRGKDVAFTLLDKEGKFVANIEPFFTDGIFIYSIRRSNYSFKNEVSISLVEK